MGKLLTKEELKLTVEHYERMRDWALTQPAEWRRHPIEMDRAIGETWFSSDCLLCKRYMDINLGIENACDPCPLDAQGLGCSEYNSPWAQINRSLTWGQLAEEMDMFLQMLDDLEVE